eukprot:327333-Pleurochrysis_carterae.AAC.1
MPLPLPSSLVRKCGSVGLSPACSRGVEKRDDARAAAARRRHADCSSAAAATRCHSGRDACSRRSTACSGGAE